jgi:hypothetical protein
MTMTAVGMTFAPAAACARAVCAIAAFTAGARVGGILCKAGRWHKDET